MMWYRLRTRAPVVALLLSAGLLSGCGGSPDPTRGRAAATARAMAAHDQGQERDETHQAVAQPEPPAVPNQVVIDNFTFTPPRLTVAVGTRVTWINRDDVPHTATSSVKPKVFNSGTLDTDQQFAHVFTVPGTYPYFCAVHPHMTAQIIVK